eukprot:CAMPEP_0115849320 /NCGR_PEP_ID=MMETSP0287-20121206/11387_1 /TAXON_ID=412157 /ORGANISM="Chrysochromulina rotalis, Strain UIO044" /LENGTH=280 /DNA_ID=CAMNT_0003303281 /DNA_START=30 /DNA_END=872 /DNA_ORIENTATION=-
MQRLPTSSGCSSIAVVALRFTVALASTLTAVFAHAIIPTKQRPIPGQEISINGNIIFIRAAENDHQFITAEEMLVPKRGLLWIALVSMLGMVCLSRQGERLSSLTTWFTAMAVADLLTTIGKNAGGVLRPNFYGGCAFDDAIRACTREFSDGVHSFPSGHSSWSACAAVLLATAALRAAENRQQGILGLIAAFALRCLAAFSFCVALFVAYSRVYDNYHFPADVVAGSGLGYSVGALSMRMLLPLAHRYEVTTDEWSHLPLISESTRPSSAASSKVPAII